MRNASHRVKGGPRTKDKEKTEGSAEEERGKEKEREEGAEGSAGEEREKEKERGEGENRGERPFARRHLLSRFLSLCHVPLSPFPPPFPAVPFLRAFRFGDRP